MSALKGSIGDLLDMGEDIEKMSDEELTAYLTPMFPLTRPNANDLIDKAADAFELSPAILAAMAEAGVKPPEDDVVIHITL